MILLTSNGLSSDNLLNLIKNEVKNRNFKTAVIITTADNEYKENNWNISRLSSELKHCSLDVSFFDFDFEDIQVLTDYDVILINGGNPYYLLDRMNKQNTKEYFKSIIEEKIIIGVSAGSIVLQKNINIVDEYSKEMNIVKLVNLEGIGLVNCEILPHYSNFLSKFENLEKRCKDYENNNDTVVIRLENGDAVLYQDNNYKIIRKAH